MLNENLKKFRHSNINYIQAYAVWSTSKIFLRLASYSHETNCRKTVSCQDKTKLGLTNTGK